MLSLGLYLLGFVFVGLTCTMTGLWGKSMGLNEHHQWVMTIGSIGIDLVVVALCLAVGWMLARQRRWNAGLLLILTLPFAAYSMIGVIGFVAGERIAKARLAGDTYVAQQTLVEQTNAVAIAMAEKRAKWLHNTYVESYDKSEKKSLLSESKAVVPTLQAPAVAAMADPQAQIIAEVTGLKVATVQIIVAVAFGILMPLGKMLCFTYAQVVRTRRIDESAGAGSAAAGETHTPVQAVARSDTVSVPAAVTLSETHDQPPKPKSNVTPLPLTKTVEAEVSHVDIDKDKSLHGVGRFFQMQTVEHMGTHTRASAMYQTYRAWAPHMGYPLCSPPIFAQIAQRLGIAKRVKSDGGADYTNRRIITHTALPATVSAAA